MTATMTVAVATVTGTTDAAVGLLVLYLLHTYVL